jgi:peptidoglycan/xylan/chitin deacetylase (PgdA/CDA1 family)
MTILCYHAVEPAWRSPLAVTPTQFTRHCEWLMRHKTVLPLHEALDSLGSSGRLPPGTAALTFDDGFSSLFEHAWPVLRRNRLPATVFLVAATLTPVGRTVDWVDTPPPHPLATLTLGQIREMQDSGVRFESHSYVHADLTTLSFDACVRDLGRSREVLEDLLGHPVRLLAYPRGRHNDVVRRAAQLAGYTHAFSLPERRETTGPYAVPRVGIYRGNGVGVLGVKSARSYLDLRTANAYRLVRRMPRPGRPRTAAKR